MPLEAFNSSASIVSALNGGVTTTDRVIVNGTRNIQTNVAQNLESGFASRIDAAIAQLNQSINNPKIDALRREQSILLSRKTRLNSAIEVLNKTLTQAAFLKSHVEHLERQVQGVIDGTITGVNAAAEWDNKLRKINILVEDATVTYKDQGVSYEKNLIKADGSRTSFTPQSFMAPYNSTDTLFINGIYLGTDYFIEEEADPNFNNISSDTFWNSDTAFLSTEEATGTMTEFASKAGFPGSPTGQSGSVQLTSTAGSPAGTALFGTGGATKELFFFSYIQNSTIPDFDGKDGIAWLDFFDNDSIVSSNALILLANAGKITKGGLGLLDAWLYNNFEANDILGGNETEQRERALEDLGVANSKIVLAEKHFRETLFTLQSQANFFDPIINGIEREISDLTETALNEQQAIVTALELESQVAQFNSSLLEARGNTLVFSLILSQDNFNQGSEGFKKTGDALFGSTLNIQV